MLILKDLKHKEKLIEQEKISYQSLPYIKKDIIVGGSYLLVSFLLSIIVILHVYQYVRIARKKFRISKLRRANYILKKNIKTLKNELEKLRAIHRINKEAQKQGLYPVEKIQYLKVED